MWINYNENKLLNKNLNQTLSKKSIKQALKKGWRVSKKKNLGRGNFFCYFFLKVGEWKKLLGLGLVFLVH